MLPLLFPWILVVLLIIAIILSFGKKWKLVAVLLVLAAILNWWAECIPLRLWQINENGNDRTIKVMSFNIDGTKEDFRIKAPQLARQIINYAPDIIFIAELCEKNKPYLDTLLLNDYPYINSSVDCWNCFYSKYPLTDWEIIEDDEGKGVGTYKSKVGLGKDTLVLYGCHLASNNYSADNKYITPDSINSHKDLKQYFSDIRHAYSMRGKETEIVFGDISKTAHPVIVMGDMNDVGGSASIRTLEDAGLKDAGWEGGFGYAATIHRPLPYRIDHIMYSDELKLKEIKVIDSEGISDHDALFAKFEY
jgi:endonuclease/exonuclease/phosphatase (EEP) superfamily protein YafD